ncbi:MAG: hypothetical protein UH734_00100 [Ruminococcus sp.]|nr:hypothetical protein [Ruminococcus sp.]
MNKETYERLAMDVTKFDVEDVITTSSVDPSPNPNKPAFDPKNPWEMPVGV